MLLFFIWPLKREFRAVINNPILWLYKFLDAEQLNINVQFVVAQLFLAVLKPL